MKQSTMLAILLLLAISSAGLGCSLWPSRPVRVGQGQVAELARPARVQCWVTDKATGKRSVRVVEAWPGWLIGPGMPTAEGK